MVLQRLEVRSDPIILFTLKPEIGIQRLTTCSKAQEAVGTSQQRNDVGTAKARAPARFATGILLEALANARELFIKVGAFKRSIPVSRRKSRATIENGKLDQLQLLPGSRRAQAWQ